MQVADECDGEIKYSPYERCFMVVVTATTVICVATVFVKFCRLRFAHEASSEQRSSCFRTVVGMLSGLPRPQTTVRDDLQATQCAMLRYTMLGVANDEDASVPVFCITGVQGLR